MVNPFELKPHLFTDRETVRAACGGDLGSKIDSYEATIDDIREWYYAHDPIAEDGEAAQLKVMGASGVARDDLYFDNFNHKLTTACRYEAAAFALLVSVIEPEVLAEHPTTWAIHYRETDSSLKDNPFAGPERVLSALFNKFPNELTEEQAGDVYMAIDCMHLASSLFRNQSSTLTRFMENGEMRIEAQILEQQCRDKADVYFPASIQLILGLAERLDSHPDPEVRNLAFKAGLFAFAAFNEQYAGRSKFHPSPEAKQAFDESMQKAVRNTAYLVREHFLGDNNEGGAIKGSAKGDLHEAIYLLDLTYLLATNQESLPHWHPKPVFPRMDSPRIGHPTVNRGVDVTANNCSRNILVQLKAGNIHADKEYHPRILLKREDNFQDVNRRRLASKLNAYLEWGDGNQSPEHIARIERYLLPSAVSTIDDIKAVQSMPESEFLMQSAPTERFSRAERRRIARTLGEFSSRKSSRKKPRIA